MSSSSSSSSSNSGVVNGREREPLIADASRKNEPIVINDARPVENNNNSPPVATAEMGRPTTYSNGNAVPVSEGRREAVIVSADGRRYYVVDRRRDRYYDDDDAALLNASIYEDKIVKVVVRNKPRMKEFEKYIDKLYSSNVHELKIVENFQLQESEDFEVEESEDTFSNSANL